MGPQGPQGVPGEGMFWKYYTYTVKSQDWQLVTSPDGLNTYYMYEFQNKDITDDLYIDGYVLGYLVQSPGADNEVITPLPYTIHKGEANGDALDRNLHLRLHAGKRSFLCAIQRFYRATARRYGISFSP